MTSPVPFIIIFIFISVRTYQNIVRTIEKVAPLLYQITFLVIITKGIKETPWTSIVVTFPFYLIPILVVLISVLKSNTPIWGVINTFYLIPILVILKGPLLINIPVWIVMNIFYFIPFLIILKSVLKSNTPVWIVMNIFYFIPILVILKGLLHINTPVWIVTNIF